MSQMNFQALRWRQKRAALRCVVMVLVAAGWLATACESSNRKPQTDAGSMPVGMSTAVSTPASTATPSSMQPNAAAVTTLDASPAAPKTDPKPAPSDAGARAAALDEDAGAASDPVDGARERDANTRDAAVATTAEDAATRAGQPDRPAAHANQTPPTWTNGIAIDERGYLWVADIPGSQLLRLEPPGEKIVERYGSEQGIDGPDDLIVDPDAVYYTAILGGTVNRLDRKTGAHSIAGSVGIFVNPIARAPSGAILAGIAPGPLTPLAALLNGLYEIDPTGTSPAKLVLPDSSSINAFCFGPDGLIYGPTPTSIVRINLTNGRTRTISTGDYYYPASVRYNARDHMLYVLDIDPANSLLYQMQLDGSGRRVFARFSVLPTDVYGADNFAIAADGTFYVTRSGSPVITRVSADGARVEDFRIGTP